MRAFMVYLDEDLYELLRKASFQSGLKMSEIVRLALKGKLETENEGDPVPLKKKAALKVSPAE
ncbi:MAG: hypothetical protein HY890_03650 [Deltaproteobacteria bacterium]|nr:hypothetical protein [Deltaproteobacteria bacterium]